MNNPNIKKLTVQQMLDFLHKGIAEGSMKLNDEFIAHDEAGNSYYVADRIVAPFVKVVPKGFIAVGVKK